MDTQPGEAEEVEVFWMPGCSSCAKVKEFPGFVVSGLNGSDKALPPEIYDGLPVPKDL